MKRVVTAAALPVVAWSIAHARSRAVRNWADPRLEIQRQGPLCYRVAGAEQADVGIVLLHGLVATGDVFGTTPAALARHHRVVVPDLLGFGRSLDEGRTDFSTSAHLDALDRVIDRELDGKMIRIGAHSMGSALALRWAERHPDRVERVVCVGAPIWPSPDAARASLGRLGPMARSLLLDRKIAQAVCSFSCRHRTLSGVISAVVAPRWPIQIARQASLHTWPAYIGALEEQIIDCPWSELIDALATDDIGVHLIRGDGDGIGDADHIARIATSPGVEATTVPGDHTLPASDPQLLADLLV